MIVQYLSGYAGCSQLIRQHVICEHPDGVPDKHGQNLNLLTGKPKSRFYSEKSSYDMLKMQQCLYVLHKRSLQCTNSIYGHVSRFYTYGFLLRRATDISSY